MDCRRRRSRRRRRRSAQGLARGREAPGTGDPLTEVVDEDLYIRKRSSNHWVIIYGYKLGKYWKAGHTDPVWFLADPVRSDLALIDPKSRQDFIDVQWPLVARPAFGGMRPSAVRWCCSWTATSGSPRPAR